MKSLQSSLFLPLVARRLGELKSIRAVLPLIEEFRRACRQVKGNLQPESHDVFQQALQRIGSAALPALVRAIPGAFSMIENREGNGAAFYVFIHEAIEFIYLTKPRRELATGEMKFTIEDLQRILENMREDKLASPELRTAAGESLKALAARKERCGTFMSVSYLLTRQGKRSSSAR